MFFFQVPVFSFVFNPEAMVALEQLKTFSRSKVRSNLPPVPPMVPAAEVLEIVDEKGRLCFSKVDFGVKIHGYGARKR